jgi:hypothetical protein
MLPIIFGLALTRPYFKLSVKELLDLCARGGNREAWDEFLRRFHVIIMTTVRRTVQRYTQPSPELCEDLARQVHAKLAAQNARLLREFKPKHDGAIFGFVKVVTASVVHDDFRKQGFVRRLHYRHGTTTKEIEAILRYLAHGDFI